MSKVYEPPEDVWVLGYTWKEGAASGGQREVFVHRASLVRRLGEIHDRFSKAGAELSNVTVHKLDGAGARWEPVEVHMPTQIDLAR